jgi:hypothetical protein
MRTAAGAKGGRHYYLDPAGSDLSSGTSPTAAWRSLARASSAVFRPGDTLSLAGGADFPGTLHLGDDDGGDPARPVIISGEGVVSATILPGDSDGITARNPIGLVIRGLSIVGSGPERNQGSGINFLVTTPGDVTLPGVLVEEVDVSGMGRFGLIIDGRVGKSGLRNVRISDSDFHGNQLAGIATRARYLPWIGGYAHARIEIERVRTWDNRGDPTLDKEHSGSGIVLSDVRGAKIERCVAWGNGSASRGRLGGPYGIWTWNADSVVVERSVSFSNRTASKADGGGFDFDGGTTNSLMRDNVSFDNDGAGVLVAQFTYARPFHDNRIERHVSIDDGRKNGYGAFTVWGGVDNTVLSSSVLVVRSTRDALPSGIQIYTNWWKHWWEKGSSRNVRVENTLVFLGPGVELVRIEPGSTGLDVGGASDIRLDDAQLPRPAPR